MANAEEILLGREGGLATLTINRPRALNALTLENYRRFAPALSGWAEDPSVQAVVVRGAGGASVSPLFAHGSGSGRHLVG